MVVCLFFLKKRAAYGGRISGWGSDVCSSDLLARAGVLEAIGGRGLLAEIVSTAPAVSNAARYARIISDHAVLRKLIGVGGEIAELGYDVPDDVEKDRKSTRLNSSH